MEPFKTVCVDLDGVLAKYDYWQGVESIGEPIRGAVQFTRELAKFCRVVIFTTRTKTDMDDRPEGATPEYLASVVKRWLDKHGFEYSEIYVGQGKPIASAYIDDRSVVCRPQDPKLKPNGNWFVDAADNARRLCNS